jgi:hypothetical protein
MKQYFLVPFDSIPADASYPGWYATWSTSEPTVVWSRTRPDVKPDGISTWVVGITIDAASPGAIALGTGSKDVPPPPLSPLKLSPPATSVSDFQKKFQQYLTARSA